MSDPENTKRSASETADIKADMPDRTTECVEALDAEAIVGRGKEAATRIRKRAKTNKGQAFDWQEWKAYRDESRP